MDVKALFGADAVSWSRVHTLMVAPDVWGKLLDLVPRDDGSALLSFSVAIVVNSYLRPGEMIPLDCNGKPLPKPGSEEVSPSHRGDPR